VTITLAGYEHSEKKIGYNGFKQSAAIGGPPMACEAKPKISTLKMKKTEKTNVNWMAAEILRTIPGKI